MLMGHTWGLSLPAAMWCGVVWQRQAAHLAGVFPLLLPHSGYERLRPYVAFHAALRSAFQAFVQGLEERCKGIVLHHLETATSEYAMGLLAGEGRLAEVTGGGCSCCWCQERPGSCHCAVAELVAG